MNSEPVDLRECAWCGMPMEAVSRWTWVERPPFGKPGTKKDWPQVEMVSARCLNSHWYGGPLEEVKGA